MLFLSTYSIVTKHEKTCFKGYTSNRPGHRLVECINIKVEGIVVLYATPSPFLLNKICLNQILKVKMPLDD